MRKIVKIKNHPIVSQELVDHVNTQVFDKFIFKNLTHQNFSDIVQISNDRKFNEDDLYNFLDSNEYDHNLNGLYHLTYIEKRNDSLYACVSSAREIPFDELDFMAIEDGDSDDFILESDTKDLVINGFNRDDIINRVLSHLDN